jgi:hypothetical protein
MAAAGFVPGVVDAASRIGRQSSLGNDLDINGTERWQLDVCKV